MNAPHTSRLCPLALAVLSLPTLAAAPPGEDTPFATAPLNLQDTSLTQKVTVTKKISTTDTQSTVNGTLKWFAKPNVMLVLDDSGSMRYGRLSSLKRALTNNWETGVIDINKDYMRLGIRWLNNNKPQIPIPEEKHNAAANKSAELINIRDIKDNVNSVREDGPTPLISNYVEGVSALAERVDDNTRDNYLILMTDGESNGYYNLIRGRDRKHEAIFQEKGKLGGYKIEIDPATAFSPWANWAYINYLINQDPFWFKRLSSEKYQKLMNENRTAWGLETDPAKIRTDPFNTTEWKVLCGNRLNSRKFSTTGFAIYEFCTKLKNEIIPNNGDKFAFYPYGPGTSSDFNPYEKTKEYFESTYKGNTRVFEPVSGYEGSKQLYTVGIDYQSYKQGQPIFAPISRSIFIPSRNQYIYLYTEDSYNKMHGAKLLNHLSRALDTPEGLDEKGQPYITKADGTRIRPIKTITIGFGSELTDSDSIAAKFLERGASEINGERQYYLSEDDIAGNLSKIFQTIRDNSTQPQTSNTTVEDDIVSGTPQESAQSEGELQESFAATSPGAAGGGGTESGVPNTGITVYLPAGLSATNLRFYNIKSNKRLDAAGKTQQAGGGKAKVGLEWDNTDFKLPDFGRRRALVRAGGKIFFADKAAAAGIGNAVFGLQGSGDEYARALLPWVTRTGTPYAGGDVAAGDNTVAAMNYPTGYRIRAEHEQDMGDVIGAGVTVIGDNKHGREQFLVTAANDGMVYLFESDNASTDHPYTLRLNYLPADLPRSTSASANPTIGTKLQAIADSQYGSNKKGAPPHVFLNNGGVVVRHTDTDRPRQIFMAGTAGQGARGAYALNVGGYSIQSGEESASSALALSAGDNPDKWKNDVPLFEVTSDTMGYTVGAPQIARIGTNYNGGKINSLDKDIRQALFVSSGFGYGGKDSPNDIAKQETALYIYDALGLDVGRKQTGSGMDTGTNKGDLLQKVTVPGGVGGLAQPTVLDVNRDGVADYVFAGDYGGSMYRFDLRTYPNIEVKRIYKGSATQPITSAPGISRQPDDRYVVIFGTGSDIYATDFSKKDRQAIYGIYQRFGANMQPVHLDNPSLTEVATETPLLLEQTFSSVEDNGKMLRRVSNQPIIDTESKKMLNNYGGWKVQLDPQDGERIVSKPEMQRLTTVLSSRVYEAKKTGATAALCSPDDGGWKSTFKFEKGTWDPLAGAIGDENYTTRCWNKMGEQRKGETQTSTNISGTQKPRDLTEEEIAQAIRAGICYKSDTVEQCDRRVAKVTVLENTISGETAVTNSSYTVEQDFVRSFDQKMDSYGWIIQLNAANGGALGAKNPAIDFVGTGAVTGGTYYFAAMRTLGIPSFRNVGASRDGYARTRDGDTGGDGKDYELGRVTHDEVENCFENLNEFIFYQTTKQQQGILDWHGKLCPRVDMRRISWREIY